MKGDVVVNKRKEGHLELISQHTFERHLKTLLAEYSELKMVNLVRKDSYRQSEIELVQRLANLLRMCNLPKVAHFWPDSTPQGFDFEDLNSQLERNEGGSEFKPPVKGVISIQ